MPVLSSSSPSDLRRPWILLLVVTTATAALCFWMFRRESAAVLRTLRERESARVAQQSGLLRADFQLAMDDLLLLAKGDALSDYLASGTQADLAQARQHAQWMAQLHPHYDQVRYIDEQGREVLRVSGAGLVGTPDSLDRSGRPYFQKASRLEAGWVYVSAFDLNAEAGRVAQPYRSTVRFATPVFDEGGRPRGVYLITYPGDGLLERLQDFAPPLAGRLRVLNSDGFWIKAAEPDWEWGFQLPDRAERTLAREDSATWSRLQQESEGQAWHRGGLLSWRRVETVPPVRPGIRGVSVDEPYLIVAAEVSPTELAAELAAVRRIFLMVGPGLVALAGGICWLWASRRASEIALRQHEQSERDRLHFIFEAVPVGISFLVTQADGTRRRLINDHHLRLCGLTREGANEPDAFARVTHPDDLVPQARLYQQLVSGKIDRFAMDKRYVSADGKVTWVMYFTQRRRTAAGATEDLSVVVDITRRKEAEEEIRRTREALQESEARYRGLFESIDEGFCIIKLVEGETGPAHDLHFVVVNPSFEKLTGLSSVAGRSARELGLHLEPIWYETYHRIAESRTSARFQNRSEHLKRTYDVYGVPFGPPGSRQVAVLFTDITKRQEAENEIRRLNETLERRVEERTAALTAATEQLRQHERRFRALIEHSSDSIALIDANNRILYLSPAVSRVEGYDPEELLGRSGLEHTHPDDLPVIQQTVEKLLEHPGQPIPVLWRRRHKDGSWRWLEGVATNLLHDPALAAIVTNYRDITPRKQAEDEIVRLAAELEDRVKRRTAELVAANQELESFSYSVSHDLRAPLRHIQGFVEMHAREVQEQISDKGRRYLGIIAKTAKDMGVLIDGLLEFSRMGRAVLRDEFVPLDHLVKSVRAELEPVTHERKIVWTIASLPPVRGDAVMLKQVYANLLGNAVKYTRQCETARIEVGQQGREGERVVLFVRDNGVGFDMKYAGKLFGVFQRLHSVEQFEGTGIGLANVQRIVVRHGGRVWVEAAPGVGATFFFTLPTADPRPAPAAP